MTTFIKIGRRTINVGQIIEIYRDGEAIVITLSARVRDGDGALAFFGAEAEALIDFFEPGEMVYGTVFDLTPKTAKREQTS